MIAEPETLTAPSIKRTVLSAEEILRFIPHGREACRLDLAWYTEEASDTVCARHTITPDDCRGHFEQLPVQPGCHIFEWLTQLGCLTVRLRFGARAELGLLGQTHSDPLVVPLIPGDIIVMRAKVLQLRLRPNGVRGHGSIVADVWWKGFQVLSGFVFDFSAVSLALAERLCQGREARLVQLGVPYDPNMLPIAA